jgi:hypothetical protein
MLAEKYCVVALFIVFQNITSVLNKDSELHIPGYVNAWELYLNRGKPGYMLNIQTSSAQSLMQLIVSRLILKILHQVVLNDQEGAVCFNCTV